MSNARVHKDSLKDYRYYEKQSRDRYNRRCIDGRIAGCGNCVGYCRYEGHRGFLTHALRQEHRCLEKGCHYYLSKPQRERPQPKTDHRKAEVERLAFAFCADYEGMRITGVKRSDDENWVARYVSITNAYSIEAMEQKLALLIGEGIRMVAVNCDFETAAAIVFSA